MTMMGTIAMMMMTHACAYESMMIMMMCHYGGDDDDDACACMPLYSMWVGSEVLGYLQNTAPVTLARTQSVVIVAIIFTTITITTMLTTFNGLH